jgi:hypothetical protein
MFGLFGAGGLMHSLGILGAVVLLILFLRSHMDVGSSSRFVPEKELKKVEEGRLGPIQGG